MFLVHPDEKVRDITVSFSMKEQNELFTTQFPEEDIMGSDMLGINRTNSNPVVDELPEENQTNEVEEGDILDYNEVVD